jgi:hypothetical protein
MDDGRVVEWEFLKYLPVVVAVAVACVVAVVVLYRSQVRSAGRGWRWFVPAFRILAVVALLASVLRPTVLRPASPDDLGQVLVVVDESASMSVVDRSWTPAELVATAASLDEMPPGVARWSGDVLREEVERVRTLIDEAARAASELQYAQVAGRSVAEAKRRAAMTRASLVSAARGLPGRAAAAPDAVRAAVQWTDVASVLDAKGAAAWAELRTRVAAAVKAIEAVQVESDAKLYASDARVRQACDSLAKLSRAELARRVVDRVLRPAMPVRDDAVPGREVRAVVLLGDGRESRALPGGVPVVACRVTPDVVKDVAIREVSVPPVAYVGDVASVRVALRAAGLAGSRVAVRVTLDGAVESKEVIVPAGGATAELQLRFTQSGVSTIAVDIGAVEGEATAENNHVERRVRVLATRPAMLAVVGGAFGRADAVRESLADVPGVSASVVSAEADWALAGGVSAVVLDDVSAATLSAEQLDAINEMVVDRGGTLVMVAGRWNWPLDAESESLLDEYLPYRVDGGGSFWRVAIGRAAEAREAGVSIELPSVRRYVQMSDLRPGVRVLMAEQESGAPVVTEAVVGRGRVVTVAADTVGDRGDVGRFWAGLVRQVVARPFAVERDGYALDTDLVDVGPDESIRVRAKVLEQRTASRDPSLLMVGDGRVVRTEALVAAKTGGVWEAVIANLPAGEYVVRLDPGVEGGAGLEVPVRVRSAREREMADVTADEAALRGLAEASGGQVVKISEPGRLVEAALRGRGDQPTVMRYRLWDSPYLFLFVTACLTTEWALRKRLGLA